MTEMMNFNADVSKLLDIVAGSLYASHDIFLRELISNASDACDKLRYEALQNPALMPADTTLRIHLYKDTASRTLTITDNGIGMSKAELIENLGTIAKSGTAAMMESARQSGASGPSLIGQFGVGFYASFMAASRVRVISRRAGSNDIWVWESDGRSGFEIREANTDDIALLDDRRGTAIVLSVRDEACEFLIDDKIKETALSYSDHIDFPIVLGRPGESGHVINKATALWARPKNDITPDQYNEFYRSITHGLDEPILTAHWRAEGKIEYTGLLFIPTMRPWDLYDPTRKAAVRLYVRRVFITDRLDNILYPWLRFVRGIIDTPDLPLNVSRDSLQDSPLIGKIRAGIAKKILGELDRLSQSDAAAYLTFWGQFGPAIKEGLYDAAEHREDILKITRFRSSHDSGAAWVSLDDYLARMKTDQSEIYYISGEKPESLAFAPQIEGLKAAGYEVLFMTDTIDDFWLQAVSDYKSKVFKSVTKGDIKIENPAETKTEDKQNPESGALIARIKDALADQVSDVRPSKRLTESPVCLVAADAGVDMRMERVLKIHQKFEGGVKPVLEINMNHPVIQKLQTNEQNFENHALILLDQARIMQGEPIPDPAGFSRRLSALMGG